MTTEAEFIAALRGLATHPAARGLEDDTAVLEFGTETLILTHDTLAEGTHFLPGQDRADIAWKLVATNMSDLAAKGAEPLGVLLGYMLGADDMRFIEGLREALDAHGVPLLGGDTIRGAGPQVLGLTAIGRATVLPAPSRSGSRPGDVLWITGPVGAAMLGFEALKAGHGDSTAYRRPTALLGKGMILAEYASAMMDISDGLLIDAARMARASGVTFAIDSASVPIATPEHRRTEALRWGEDYQLLFTTSPQETPPADVCRIGEAIQAKDHPILLDGTPLSETDNLGYQH